MTPTEYLDAAKLALGVSSNYALAKALDVPEQNISDYYREKAVPSDETCAKLALALEMPIGEVLADIRRQTAKTPRAREFWQSFLARIRSTTLIVVLATFGGSYALAPSACGGGGGRFRAH